MMKYYAGKDICEAITEMFERIGAMPAADVVKVVRCKDCRFFQTDECCYGWPVQNANDYCSKGERIEVVRCKDCDMWDEKNKHGGDKVYGNLVAPCGYFSNEDGYTVYTEPNDYCGKGERKEGEE